MNKEAFFMGKFMKAKIQHTPVLLADKYHLSKQYIVMQIVEYSIPEYLEKFKGVEGRIELPEISDQMLSALRALHDGGFIHQDVKPDNYRISEDNKVYILDFGIVQEFR